MSNEGAADVRKQDRERAFGEDPALRDAERQAVRNQSVVSPEDYPAGDRSLQSPKAPGDA